MTFSEPPNSLQTPASVQETIDRLQSLAMLGELTGTATHEFNNVLMTIMNYAKLGLRNQDMASREKALTKILEASQRAAQISNTILAQARNRADVPEPTNLGDLVRETLVLMERELQKYRVFVDLELADPLPTVVVSGNAIVRVLINLMTNARQAMSEGGTLTLRVSAKIVQDVEYLELVVRDSGAGIPPEILPRIFEPFYSTKSGPDESGKGGTGLGLAACKKVVDQHKGRIRVETSPGRGTAFIILLPTQQPQQVAA